MSYELGGKVIADPDIDKQSEFCVMLALADATNRETMTCYPSLNRIASVARCSRSTAIRVLSDLESKGWIRIIRRVSAASPWESNLYQIIKYPSVTMTPPPSPTVEPPSRTMTPPPVSNEHTPSPTMTPPPSVMVTPKPGRIEPGIEPISKNQGKDVLRTSKRHIEPDRFESEEAVIRFVLTDTQCRSLKALAEDGRWFWNGMLENDWHRDAAGKNPVRDAKATCRKWMAFSSRPTWNVKDSQAHRERWKMDCQIHTPQEELL